jgi:hypothetical protein
MRLCGSLALAVILCLSACSAREIRCDHDLQPINAPRAKSTAVTAPTAHLPTRAAPAIPSGAMDFDAVAMPKRTGR